ncbi:MAG: condensation domain-containing protein, partial [Methylococcales bacterium]
YFYNVPFAYRLRGKVEVGLLRESLQAMLRRHDFLRTTLRDEPSGGGLMQVVTPFAEERSTIGVPVVDLQQVPEVQRHDQALRVMQSEWRRPFDLARDCPLWVCVLQLAEAEHILFLCLHNVGFEAGSLTALLHELGAHYAAFAAGSSSALAPLPMQYADCVRWQQALVANGMEARLAYWREWFRPGEPPALTLGIAKRSQPATTFDAGILDFEFPADLTTGLNQLCQRAGVTLFIPILAAYALVLKRHSGFSDIVLGTSFANRNHWKLEPLIGSMLNVVALRFDLSGSLDFVSLLRNVRDIVLSAFSQQEVPFAYVQPLLEPGRPRATPLFRTVLTFFGELPNDRLRFPGIEVTTLDKIYCDSMFPDLYPTFWEKKTDSGTVLKGYWQYKRELYERSTVEQMLLDFRSMLEAMVRDPEQSIHSDSVHT